MFTIFDKWSVELIQNNSHLSFNSSPPSAAYMGQWTGPSMVLVMACRLFAAKPLPEPMLAYCQLDSCEQISVKLHNFIQENAFENIVCQNGGHFVPGGGGGDNLKSGLQWNVCLAHFRCEHTVSGRFNQYDNSFIHGAEYRFTGAFEIIWQPRCKR